MATMTNRARVTAALHGEPVDRVPISFWAHNFALENSAEDLRRETIRIAETFGWDYLKPQSRAQCFAEMWGLTYRPSTERAEKYTVISVPLRDAAGLAALRPADPRTGALAEQIDALRQIRAAIGPDTPIIWTVFSPMMVARYLLPGDQRQLLEIARSEPAALERGLGAISQTLAAYAAAAIEAGADGLFFATTAATRAQVSVEECRRFQRPFDLPILEAVRRAPFNVMHVCGDDVLFDEFLDYPVAAFSWALSPNNPTLADGHRRSGRAVIGGIPGKPAIATMTPEAVAERVRAAIREMDGRWLLLGPDCSINPDTPDELLHAARATAHGLVDT